MFNITRFCNSVGYLLLTGIALVVAYCYKAYSFNPIAHAAPARSAMPIVLPDLSHTPVVQFLSLCGIALYLALAALALVCCLKNAVKVGQAI